MKETKKVSVNAIESVMKEQFSNEVTIQWYGVDITIQKTIGLVKSFEFVTEVVNSCFSEADGSYMPEMKDFLIRACMIDYYTNIRLPENSEKMYEMLYRTDLCRVICANIDGDQFRTLVDAVNEKLDYLSNADVKAMQKTSAMVTALAEQFQAMFSGVSNEDIQKLTDAISNGNFDEEKLVQAYAKMKAQEPDAAPVEVLPKQEAGE